MLHNPQTLWRHTPNGNVEIQLSHLTLRHIFHSGLSIGRFILTGRSVILKPYLFPSLVIWGFEISCHVLVCNKTLPDMGNGIKTLPFSTHMAALAIVTWFLCLATWNENTFNFGMFDNDMAFDMLIYCKNSLSLNHLNRILWIYIKFNFLFISMGYHVLPFPINEIVILPYLTDFISIYHTVIITEPGTIFTKRTDVLA